MSFYLLVKCLTTLQTLWDYLKHYHIREALSCLPATLHDFPLTDLTRIKSWVTYLTVLCINDICVLVFCSLYTMRSLGVENMTLHICIYSLCCLKQHSLSEKKKKINRIFQERWQLGSEVLNQSFIKYLILGLHEIPYFKEWNSLHFGFIDNYKIYLSDYQCIKFPFLFFGTSFSSQALIH